MRHSVSVLIPTYNSADLLCETIEAILLQTYPASEIIIVDDGSSDHTRQALSRFGDRVTYYLTENGGPCRARNIAASKATSSYLAFTDADDLWRPDKLEKQMALHNANPAVEFSFTNFSIVENGIWAKKTEFDHAPDKSFPPYSLSGTDSVVLEEPFYNQVLAFQPVRPSTIAVSKRLFYALGGLREQFGRNPSEDVEFTLRCVQNPPIGVVREPVVGIRKHGSNFSGSEYRNLRGQIEIYQYALEHHQINSETRELLLREIDVRRVQAAYLDFRDGNFDQVRALLEPISRVPLDWKSRMKLVISKFPAAAARSLQTIFVKKEV